VEPLPVASLEADLLLAEFDPAIAALVAVVHLVDVAAVN